MSFEKELEKLTDLINSNLNNIINEKYTEKTIKNAIEYSLLAGGKRVRPILVLLITKALKGDLNRALPFALSIECIHTYSLIHDDLPAMDNDDLRRGIPTSHIKFGEANAILSGDGLLNLAFEIIFSDIMESKGEKDNLIEAGSIISCASGIKGMIAGQIIDIESEGKEISIEKLIEMHSKKTGALIEASCKIPGLITNRKDLLEDLSEYGKSIGLAFQIIDDILDYTGDPKLLGKNIGGDKENRKSTFITLLGLNKSKEFALDLTNKAIEISDKIDESGFLSKYTKYLLERKN